MEGKRHALAGTAEPVDFPTTTSRTPVCGVLVPHTGGRKLQVLELPFGCLPTRLAGMSRGRTLGMAVGAAILHATLLSAQDTAAYRHIIEMYRAGGYADAVAAVRRLPAREIEAQVRQLIATDRSSVLQSPEAMRVQHRVWLQAALLLHTETLYGLRDERSSSAAAERPAHELAEALLVAALQTPAERPGRSEADDDRAFLQAWYLLTIADAQARQQLLAANRFASVARKRLGDYPELLLAIGAFNEMAWAFEHDQDMGFGLGGDLGEAEAMYRASLSANPRIVETRVRLGRVLTLRGNLDGAVRTFGEVPPDTEPAFRYLTRLFEGDAFERRGELARAAESYAAAIETLPDSQSARLALAHLRHAEGNRSDALARVTTLASAPKKADDTSDPWWWYLKGIGWRAPGYLEWLRAAVKP
jgi:tetratricopeptide (TPR) repeat protein